MGILRMIAVIGGVMILFIVVVTTGQNFLPGTKIRKLNLPQAEEGLWGDDYKGPKTMANFMSGEQPPKAAVAAMAADAGTGPSPDAGVVAAGGY